VDRHRGNLRCPTTGYGSRWDDDDYEAGEVIERSVGIAEWRRPDGSPSPLGEFPVKDDELCPPDALDDMEPDEEEFQEATVLQPDLHQEPGELGMASEATHQELGGFGGAEAVVLSPCSG
jgi:hypothetical protein